MNVKKALALLLSLCMALSLAACGGGGGNSDAASGDSGSKAAGEVSIFYYTFNDTYLSSVRSAMDAALSAAGVNFNNYDGNNIQTTQTDSIDTAIAKGASILAVNLVDTGSNDAAQNIVDKAKAQSIPVVFFNRSVEESVVSSYDNCAFVGTDYTQAGKMQGDMIGQYLVDNYDAVDLNGDGVISYVMFKGDEANQEAIYRTQYGQENADAILAEAGKPALKFYDDTNANRYLVDQNGACRRRPLPTICRLSSPSIRRPTTIWSSWSSPTMTKWPLARLPRSRTPGTTPTAKRSFPCSAWTPPTPPAPPSTPVA